MLDLGVDLTLRRQLDLVFDLAERPVLESFSEGVSDGLGRVIIDRDQDHPAGKIEHPKPFPMLLSEGRREVQPAVVIGLDSQFDWIIGWGSMKTVPK